MNLERTGAVGQGGQGVNWSLDLDRCDWLRQTRYIPCTVDGDIGEHTKQIVEECIRSAANT